MGADYVSGLLPRNLRVSSQDDGSVLVEWEAPAAGSGPPASHYEVTIISALNLYKYYCNNNSNYNNN